jgi:hypothetical protein
MTQQYMAEPIRGLNGTPQLAQAVRLPVPSDPRPLQWLMQAEGQRMQQPMKSPYDDIVRPAGEVPGLGVIFAPQPPVSPSEQMSRQVPASRASLMASGAGLQTYAGADRLSGVPRPAAASNNPDALQIIANPGVAMGVSDAASGERRGIPLGSAPTPDPDDAAILAAGAQTREQLGSKGKPSMPQPFVGNWRPVNGPGQPGSGSVDSLQEAARINTDPSSRMLPEQQPTLGAQKRGGPRGGR